MDRVIKIHSCTFAIGLFLLCASCEAAAPFFFLIDGAKIKVNFSPFERLITNNQIIESIEKCAAPVVSYYGKFPVRNLTIDVVPNTHHEKGFFGMEYDGVRISYFIGRKATANDLMKNGVLTHELYHLGFPSLEDEVSWIEEGLASYLDFLTRQRAGQLTQADFWLELKDGFEDAIPRKGEGGLNQEERYRRKYWGGALFWMSIDLEIRTKTKEKKSLDTITRAILNSGVNNGMEWKLSKLQRKVDQKAGFPLFDRWYTFFGPKAQMLDLSEFWKGLGVVFHGQTVSYDSSAPLAKIRKHLLER